MKPKELKAPFNWEQRRPTLTNRVLYVPNYYFEHEHWTFPGWNDPLLFGNDNPVSIEYCAGNGLWIAHKAQENPNRNWVAVEKRFDRVRKIWAKIQNLSIPNLVVVSGEALTFTSSYLPDACVDEIYVNFPDPWPKSRHAKNRIIQKPFVEQVARIVKKGGKAIFATDHFLYCQQMIEQMHRTPHWRSTLSDPFFATDWADYGTSYFESLWREQGRSIHYLQFENQ